MLFAFSGEAFAATVRVKSLKITNGNVCIQVGDSITLKTTITPSKATNKGVDWSISSKDKKVATVSKSGVVKGLKPGTVTITAVSRDNKKVKDSCKITVVNTVKSISYSVSGVKKDGSTYYTIGKTSVKAHVNPSNASQSVTYSSSNNKIATVSNKGEITPKGYGTCKITIQSNANKKITATFTVLVKKGVIINASKRFNPGIEIGNIPVISAYIRSLFKLYTMNLWVVDEASLIVDGKTGNIDKDKSEFEQNVAGAPLVGCYFDKMGTKVVKNADSYLEYESKYRFTFGANIADLKIASFSGKTFAFRYRVDKNGKMTQVGAKFY